MAAGPITHVVAPRIARHAIAALALLGGLLVATAGHANTAASSFRDAQLHAAFGGAAGIERVVDAFIARTTTHPEMKSFFKDTKLDRLKKHLSEQLCFETGGGCAYTGDSMKDSHQGMGVTMKDYNLLVELLQQSMDEVGVPFNAQLRLLARLAPMYRDIIER